MSMSKYATFQGKKTRLRAVTEKDLPQLYQWDKDEELSRWMGRQFYCEQEVREWYLGGSHLHRMVYAIDTLEGRLIGEIEIINISWRLHSGEIRVFIGDKMYWNRGYGTDAIQALVKGLFNVTKLEEIVLRVDEDNIRAKRCYKKVGFKALGRVKVRDDYDNLRSLLLMKVTAEAVS